jgi:hypothetical protein
MRDEYFVLEWLLSPLNSAFHLIFVTTLEREIVDQLNMFKETFLYPNRKSKATIGFRSVVSHIRGAQPGLTGDAVGKK